MKFLIGSLKTMLAAIVDGSRATRKLSIRPSDLIARNAAVVVYSRC